jgi:predicted transcriptional regulator
MREWDSISAACQFRGAKKDMSEGQRFSELAAEIVAAYVSNNTVRPEDLGALIGDVHTALKKTPKGPVEPAPEPQEPAVSVRKSVTPDYIVCLEDGKKFKSLKRHLQNAHGMSPADYRAKWGLKKEYPMVAANYSEARSSLARTIGLGRKPGQMQVPQPAPVEQGTATPAPKRARRAKASA